MIFSADFRTHIVFISPSNNIRKILSKFIVIGTTSKSACLCHGSWVPGPILTVSCLCACAYV